MSGIQFTVRFFFLCQPYNGGEWRRCDDLWDSKCFRNSDQIMMCQTFLFLPSYSDCAPKTPAPQALDDAVAMKLWDLSASMVGLA